MGGDLLPAELLVVLSPFASSTHAYGTPLLDSKLSYPDYQPLCQFLSELSSQFPQIHIRLLLCPRSWVAAARNMGAVYAQYEWLAFLDSDDLWKPRKLLCQWKYLQQRPHLRACHTAEEWFKKGQLLKTPIHLQARGGRFLMAAFCYCLISCSSLLIHKGTFWECGGFDEDFEVCEDFAFFLRYLHRYPIGLLSECLTTKRAGNWQQLSKRYHSMDAWRLQALLDYYAFNKLELRSDEKDALVFAIRDKFSILQKGTEKHKSVGSIRRLKEIENAIKQASLLFGESVHRPPSLLKKLDSNSPSPLFYRKFLKSINFYLLIQNFVI